MACGFPLPASDLVAKSAFREPELQELELASDVVNLVTRLGLKGGATGDGEELDVVSDAYSSGLRRNTRGGSARQQLRALESAVCRVRRSECTRHHMWDRQRAALLDLHLVRVWQSLDDLLEAQRALEYADRQRRGFIGILLNHTIAHVVPAATAATLPAASEQSQHEPSSMPEADFSEAATGGTFSATDDNASDGAAAVAHHESDSANDVQQNEEPAPELQVESTSVPVSVFPCASEPMDTSAEPLTDN